MDYSEYKVTYRVGPPRMRVTKCDYLGAWTKQQAVGICVEKHRPARVEILGVRKQVRM